MTKIQTLMGWAVLAASAMLVSACGDDEPALQWQRVALDTADVEMEFPCAPLFARREVDFGMAHGTVPVEMAGCDAVNSTFALSHWVLEDAEQADDALAFWQAAVLASFQAVDGEGAKSGAAFVPSGALELPRSIRATVQGEGRAGWTVTTHGAWFARQEGQQVRIFHAVIYAPKPYHRTAQHFFNSIVLK